MNLLDVTASHDDGRFWARNDDVALSWPAEQVGIPRLAGPVAVRLGVRAEHVRLLAPGEDDPSSVTGVVSLIEPLGADTFIEVAVGAIGVTCRIEPHRPVRLGDRVRVSLPASALHLFDAATGDRIQA